MSSSPLPASGLETQPTSIRSQPSDLSPHTSQPSSFSPFESQVSGLRPHTSDDVLVRVENVSKKFCRSLKRSLWYGMKDLGNELIGCSHGGNGELRPDEFWAVKDVSFELKRGECLGLIGRNGAGKSTLLKMLNGLIKPDEGRITIYGRVGALIELGAGFNPILTGRENIYVNGAVLGFTKDETNRKFDDIVDFAEVGEFIDTPVQNYSSGMKVRLGFAVAAQMEPDILIIDEVLAVGDAAFRTKCVGLIAEVAKKSSVIFVSHAMPLIGRMSNKAILLCKGQRQLSTYDVSTNIFEYFKLNKNTISYTFGEDNLEIECVYLKIGNRTYEGNTFEISKFSDLEIIINFRLKKRVNDFFINIAFFDQEEKNIAETFSSDSDFYIDAQKTKAVVKVTFKKFVLGVGKYYTQIGVMERKPDGSRGEIYFSRRGIFNLVISGNSIGYAPVQLDCEWSATI